MQPLCNETRKLFAPLDRPLRYSTVIKIELGDNGKFIIDAYSLDGKYRSMPCSGFRQLMNRLPEKRLVAQTKTNGQYMPWEIGATDTTCEIIKAVAMDRVEFTPEARQLFDTILLQAELSDNVSQLIANFKQKGIVPEHQFELCEEKPLAGYQQVAMLAQTHATGFGLFMEQGTGKTPVVIASICNRAKELKEKEPNRFYTAIIVCPNSVRANWVSEFENFATRGGRVTVLRGSQIDRVKLLIDAFSPDTTGECYYSVVILSYQTLWRSWESLKMIPWDLSVLDEGHNIKDSKAKQSRCCLELRDCSKQRAILTGTPIGNTIMDLYMPLEFMGKGESGFTTEKAYRQFYGSYDRSNGFEVLVGTQNLPILQERLARKSFFISKKEAMPSLPDKVYDIIEIEMSPVQQEMYNKLARELAIEIENDMQNDNLTRQMLVTCILTKLLRLSQITSGFISWSKVEDEYGEITQPPHYEYFSPSPKIDAVVAELLAKTDKTEKTIIWACWLPDIAYLAAACEQNDIGYCIIKGVGKDYSEADRAEAIRRFNEDRDCRVVIGTAASGGSGLNLLGYPPGKGDEYDTDCTHIIYYSQNWSQIHRSQSEDRAHRRGTRRNVRITDVCVPNTIDEQIRLRVMSKRKNAMEASDLRHILEAITAGGN